jgi:hypothetical protein
VYAGRASKPGRLGQRNINYCFLGAHRGRGLRVYLEVRYHERHRLRLPDCRCLFRPRGGRNLLGAAEEEVGTAEN